MWAPTLLILDAQSVQPVPSKMSFVLGTLRDALPVLLCHRRPRFRLSVQPVKNKRLDHALGIGQMLRAIILECGEGLAVEAVRPLDRFGLWFGCRCTAC